MKTIYNVFTARLRGEDVRKEPINDKPSMTVPNQSLSIQEIMVRFRAGVPVQGVRDVVYNDGLVNEVKNPNYDLVDAHMALQEIGQKLDAERKKQAEIKKAEDDKRSAEEEANKIEAAVQKRLKKAESLKKQTTKEVDED